MSKDKSLKDNMKEVVQLGEIKCYSISEVLNTDFKQYKKDKIGFNLVTYRGKTIILDLENDSASSLFSNLQYQINDINNMFN